MRYRIMIYDKYGKALAIIEVNDENNLNVLWFHLSSIYTNSAFEMSAWDNEKELRLKYRKF